MVAHLSNNIGELHLQHKALLVGRKSIKGGLMVWHTVMRSLWLERNTVVFSNAHFDVLKILDLIKRRSWSWTVMEKEWKVEFSAWCVNPLVCMKY